LGAPGDKTNMGAVRLYEYDDTMSVSDEKIEGLVLYVKEG